MQASLLASFARALDTLSVTLLAVQHKGYVTCDGAGHLVWRPCRLQSQLL